MNKEIVIRVGVGFALAAAIFATGIVIGRHIHGQAHEGDGAHSTGLAETHEPQSQVGSLAHVVPNCDRSAAYYDPQFLVLAANLDWNEGPAPVGMEALLQSTFGIARGSPVKNSPGDQEDVPVYRYAKVDLVEDEVPELIVEYRPNSGSGGRSFVVLTKVGSEWKVAYQFLGGFLAKKTARKFEDLVVYERVGDDYTRVFSHYDVRRHQYVEKSRITVPQELHDLPSGYIDMWNFFWFLAGDRPGCAESKVGRTSDYMDFYRPKLGSNAALEEVPIRFHNDAVIAHVEALKMAIKNNFIAPMSPEEISAFFGMEARADWGANP